MLLKSINAVLSQDLTHFIKMHEDANDRVEGSSPLGVGILRQLLDPGIENVYELLSNQSRYNLCRRTLQSDWTQISNISLPAYWAWELVKCWHHAAPGPKWHGCPQRSGLAMPGRTPAQGCGNKASIRLLEQQWQGQPSRPQIF